MELKNKLSLGAKRVEYLMEEYFDRQKALGYCKQCPNFSKYWSCPTYIFDEAIFLKQFKYMHIIGRQFEVPRDDIRNIRDPKEISRYCIEKLDAMKVMTWQTLLEIENEVEGAVGLIPGNCPICEIQKMECARKVNQPCRNPGLMRYSLESLGFDVASLVKYEVGMTLEWSENMRLPKVITSVSAILCNEEIPKEILRKYFPDKKKSWVKYAPDVADTGFHVSEKIKPSETVHGNLEEVRATACIIDDEIPPYRPQKSWVGYKAERDPDDAKPKKGWTVTVQGDEFIEPEKTPRDEAVEKLYEEDAAPAVKEEVIVEAVAAPEPAEPEIEEEDDSKYRWLGFKAKADDDEFLNRPIRKMSELVLEGEEQADPEEASADDEGKAPEADAAQPAIETVVVAEETAVLETVPEQIASEAAAAEADSDAEPAAEEEDDSKYQWLGFKSRVDEEEEPIVTKNTLSTLNIPE
jgi:predicted metal-binding protein